MAKQHWIRELTVDQFVKIEVRLTKNEVRKDKNGGEFLYCEVSDRTGVLVARRFQPAHDERQEFTSLKYAIAEGYLEEYRGGPVFKICAPLRPLAAVCPADFEPCSPLDPAELRERLDAHIRSIQDGRLRALVSHVYCASTIKDSLFTYPAAVSIHHAFRHGLLHHTLEVADIAVAIGAAQRRWGWHAVSHDLVVTGALLHDIGKAEEYVVEDGEYRCGVAGSLLGHIVLGQTFLARSIAQVNRRLHFPKELEWQVLHLVASHHGQGEWGSPKAPMTAEACILHMADKTSADLYQFEAARSAGQRSGQLFVKRPMLDSGFGHPGRDVFVGDLPVETAADRADAVEPVTMEEDSARESREMYLPRAATLPILRIVSYEAAEGGKLASHVPIVGRIAAGAPLLNSAYLDDCEWVEHTGEWDGSGSCFLLRVQGDSMIGDGIRDGDLVLARQQDDADNGEIVVALLDGVGATIKRLERNGGRTRLLPSNTTHAPIEIPYGSKLDIQGAVVAIARRGE